MNDFEKMCRIITKFPKRNEDGEECYNIRKFDKKGAHAIYFATDDSYCWAGLYFDKNGNFVGFSPEWDEIQNE